MLERKKESLLSISIFRIRIFTESVVNEGCCLKSFVFDEQCVFIDKQNASQKKRKDIGD